MNFKFVSHYEFIKQGDRSFLVRGHYYNHMGQKINLGVEIHIENREQLNNFFDDHKVEKSEQFQDVVEWLLD